MFFTFPRTYSVSYKLESCGTDFFVSRKILNSPESRLSRPEKFLIVPISFVPCRIFLNRPEKSRLSRQRKKFQDIILFKNHCWVQNVFLKNLNLTKNRKSLGRL